MGAFTAQEEGTLPLQRFIIEREIPQVGSLGSGELKGAAAKSNDALSQLAPKVQ